MNHQNGDGALVASTLISALLIAGCGDYGGASGTSGIVAAGGSDAACTPGTQTCQRNAEKVVTCSENGLEQEVTEDCGAQGQVCLDGACATVDCWPTTYYCSGSTVRHCEADGTNSTLVSTCASSEYCDATTGTCKTQICEPSQPACDGEIATTCNADGSGYAAHGTDCTHATAIGICSRGSCEEILCPGAVTLCVGSRLVRCSYEWGLPDISTCSSSQGCGAESCEPLLCTPGQPTCDGNTATVCSSSGLAYESDGTSCGTQLCLSGTCQDALFAEDFEDESLPGWEIAPTGESSYTRSVAATDGAAGTTRSLVQTRDSVAAGYLDGIYQTFASHQPHRISWWVMATSRTTASGGFVLTSTSGTSDVVAFSYFAEGGTLVLGDDTPIAILYEANVWYHIELLNLDWTAKTFDYYVNDTLILAAAPFRVTSANDIGRLDLFNPGNATAYWDEITFE